MNIVKGRIYKPDRILYYINPTQDEMDNFYIGNMPTELTKYDGAFGTYDYPGLFCIYENGETKKVLGIEYRPDDERINYPKDLKSVKLSKCFMFYLFPPDDGGLSENIIQECVDVARQDKVAMKFHGGVFSMQEVPALIQAFSLHGHCRVLIQTDFEPEAERLSEVSPKSTMEEKLYEKAYIDSITGHYNWNYLWPIIAEFGRKNIQDYSFVLFDIKDFKAVNCVYGHESGNGLLRRVAQKLSEQEWIYYSARCDNDNFAAMIKDMPQKETRQKLSDLFNELSVLMEGDEYRIYFRCAVVPMRNTLLLGDVVADAGKQVQALGNRLYETEILFYTDSMYDDQDWLIRTRAYLDTAIREDEFLIHLQPKYNIHTEKICGSEALIRWKYHGRQLISPFMFVPVFEAGGLISKVDDIVLKKACQNIKKWKEMGLPLYPISVNLSRKSIGNPNLTEHLESIVDEYGVDHSLIDFELTESAAYDNQALMISVIKNIKSKGFKISMDDFGTGYSSLSLLCLMPFNTLKIDKSFIDGIGYGEDKRKERVVVKHIIEMAKDLGMTCLAEGVEEKEKVDLLKEFGCDVIQGYYFSKPVTAEEYERMILQ